MADINFVKQIKQTFKRSNDNSKFFAVSLNCGHSNMFTHWCVSPLCTEKAGAELCQAQAHVDLPAEVEFNLIVVLQNCTSLENVICAHVRLFSAI